MNPLSDESADINRNCDTYIRVLVFRMTSDVSFFKGIFILSKNMNKKYEQGSIDIQSTVACVLKYIVNTALSATSKRTEAINLDAILTGDISDCLFEVLSAIIAPKAIYGKE